MTRYIIPNRRTRSARRSAGKSARRSAGKSARRRSAGKSARKSAGKSARRRSRQRGGSMISVLKTALLPFLFYKAQKTQQRRVIRNKQKTRKLRRRR